jgi:hypothetical protein
VFEGTLIVTDSQFRDGLEFLTAASTAIAALFAAFSAWTSRLSAKAAQGAVKEARLARRTELAPKLILEKEFLDFIFFWPHADSLNGEAVFLARKHWKDKSPTAPTFILQNFGQSPALEVTIVWNLDDPNGEFQLPSGYERLGLSLEDGFASEEQGTIKNLVYAKRDGNGACGLPLYRKWTTDIPSCSPGQKRVVEFPTLILNTLFLRGLQLGASASDSDIILTAEISCYAVDAVRYKSQFRWKAIPFHYGETNPIVGYGHFFELPIHPKPEGPRVA